LFSEDKNFELLQLLLEVARGARSVHEKRLARIEDSVREFEAYAKVKNGG
jgi:hypothetical protein